MSETQKHTKPNVPNLRFPGFEGEWKSCNLGEIASLSKGVGISKDQRTNDGNPCILYGELYTTYSTEIIDEVVSKTNLPAKGLVKSEANDVIIPASGETAIDISTARCVTQSDVFLGGDLNIIRLKGHDGKFFSYQLNGVRKKDIAMVAQGVSIVHLHGSDLETIRVCYPSRREQEKISGLLSLIDQRIAIQNRVIERYESLIKALNQHHFRRVRVDETISFVNLSDILHERREYCENDGTYPHASLSKEGVDVKTERFDRDFLVRDEEKKYKVTRLNDICYNPANLKFGVITRNKKGPLIFSPIYVTFSVSDNFDPEYIEYYLTEPDFIRKMLRFEQGTVYERMAVSPEDFLSERIRIPDKKSQTKHAHLISEVNRYLDSERRLLNNWLCVKRYILSEMFI